MVAFGQNWLYSGKVVILGKKMVVFGQIGCFRANMVVLGQKWLSSKKSGLIRAKLFYSGKIGCIRAK